MPNSGSGSAGSGVYYGLCCDPCTRSPRAFTGRLDPIDDEPAQATPKTTRANSQSPPPNCHGRQCSPGLVRFQIHYIGQQSASKSKVCGTTHHETPSEPAASAVAPPDPITADTRTTRSPRANRAQRGTWNVVSANFHPGHTSSSQQNLRLAKVISTCLGDQDTTLPLRPAGIHAVADHPARWTSGSGRGQARIRRSPKASPSISATG